MPGSSDSNKSLAVSLGGHGGGCGGPPEEAGWVSGTLSGEGGEFIPAHDESGDRQQLDLENQRGVRGNCAGVTSLSIGKLWWNGQPRLVAHAHGGYAFIPALDHLAGPQDEGKWFIPVD